MWARRDMPEQAMNVVPSASKLIADWTLLDQIAVAALTTGDDALAKVSPFFKVAYNRVASIR